MAKLRLGIVGVGRHGSRYAKHAAFDVDDIELVAVSRRDPSAGAAAAERFGCEYVSEAETLVRRPDIDAVVLVTVPSALPPLVLAACETGKRVLVEKPVARTLDEGIALLAAIERAGIYCMAGHTLRFNAAVAALRRELASLGRLDSLLFSQRFPPQLDLAWLDTPEQSGGGSVLHTGVHCFDLLRWLAGTEVVAAASEGRSVCTRHTEDHFVASLATSDPGLLAQVACSRSTASRNGLIEASGEHGQVVVDHVLGTGYRLDAGGRRELEIGEPALTIPLVLQRLADDARADREPSIPYRDGLRAVAIADACYRSMGSHSFEAVRSLSVA